MRNRERENPCGICGHYHKFEEGEVCGVCGHTTVTSAVSDKAAGVHLSAFPTEILPHFLYLGSYDNASRSELLKSLGISRVLNTVPSCQNLYKNSFTYHYLQDDKNLQFDDANQFLEQCERDKARVLVHCMLGKNRSPAIVIAYLMKSRGWRLSQSYQWVKERRPLVDLTEGVYNQLQQYEETIFGSRDGSNFPLPVFASFSSQSVSFDYSKASNPVSFPTSSGSAAVSIFSQPVTNAPTQEFTFGVGQPLQNIGGVSLTGNSPSSNCGDISMDSS
ncbi:hypothetical protein MLD38_029259 [Melastoma candidum]|uniref:Uncharacterized protein n=1 Tax=Melastoma candidum TaxID=119954 RepID=A0ACB9N383_9MYRT|nr:hypothetical protein MLD38_029259 [Melastoma candidum]